MRDSNHQPWSKTETAIWNLDKRIMQMVRMASAREGVDPDIIAERALEMMLSPDGRTKSQRAREEQAREEAARAQRVRRLGLSHESKDEAVSISDANEIERLIRLANEVRQ